ncbi:MAG: helix-turn-helix domain-containing protein [Solirubrobacteraceae bacterium]
MTDRTSHAAATKLAIAQKRYSRSLAKAKQSRDERDATIVGLVAQGYPQTEIARVLGVTKARINHIVKAAQNEAPANGPGSRGTTHEEKSHEHASV